MTVACLPEARSSAMISRMKSGLGDGWDMEKNALDLKHGALNLEYDMKRA
jgi:hypothetical protein